MRASGSAPASSSASHHVEVGRLLQLHFLRLREARARLPARVDRGPERRDAEAVGRDVRLGAFLDEEHRDVELAVDERDEERRVAVGRLLIEIGAGVEQRGRGLHVALTRRVMQRGHAALGGDRRRRSVFVETALALRHCQPGAPPGAPPAGCGAPPSAAAATPATASAGRGSRRGSRKVRHLAGRVELTGGLHGRLLLAGRRLLPLRYGGFDDAALELHGRAVGLPAAGRGPRPCSRP